MKHLKLMLVVGFLAMQQLGATTAQKKLTIFNTTDTPMFVLPWMTGTKTSLAYGYTPNMQPIAVIAPAKAAGVIGATMSIPQPVIGANDVWTDSYRQIKLITFDAIPKVAQFAKDRPTRAISVPRDPMGSAKDGFMMKTVPVTFSNFSNPTADIQVVNYWINTMNDARLGNFLGTEAQNGVYTINLANDTSAETWEISKDKSGKFVFNKK